VPAKVRIKPELITEHRLRIEMTGLEDEDVENTIRMKGWAWVRSREAWVYAGEPDFTYRQIREVIIGLPDIVFDEEGIEESIRSVDSKARSHEERGGPRAAAPGLREDRPALRGRGVYGGLAGTFFGPECQVLPRPGELG
jgi:hypothetical protein